MSLHLDMEEAEVVHKALAIQQQEQRLPLASQRAARRSQVQMPPAGVVRRRGAGDDVRSQRRVDGEAYPPGSVATSSDF